MIPNPAADIKIVSADVRLYAKDEAVNVQSSAFKPVGMLYRGASYFRCVPRALVADSENFTDIITKLTADQLSNRQILPPSVIVEAESAIVWHNHIFTDEGGELRHLYEFMRPGDQVIWTPDTGRLAKAMSNAVDMEGPVLFVGSAGSRNYGHFLVDDLPRLKASNGLPVVMTAYSDEVNEVRRGAAEALGIELRLIDPEIPTRIHNVRYATPVSIHPAVKSQEALAWVGNLSSETTGRRLYVPRITGRRKVVDQAALDGALAEHGFETIDVTGMSFGNQVKVFSEATHVLGVMGAAMTNTVFCRPGTKVGYLAPEHWGDVFYWDLASVCQHDYSAYYCTRADPKIESSASDIIVNPEKFSGFINDFVGRMHELSAVPAHDELGPDYFKDFPAV